MTTDKPRADFVLCPGDSIQIIYPAGIKLAQLKKIAANLQNETGMATEARRVRLDNEYNRAAIFMEPAGLEAKVDEAVRQLREVSNPRLPIGVGVLQVELLICPCGYTSTVHNAERNFRFVRGFEPEDNQAFMLRYYAAMQKLPVSTLLSESPKPPYIELMHSLENVLGGLGAHATMIEIKPQPDHRPCTHS